MKEWITVFAAAPRGGKIGVCCLADRTIRLQTKINVSGTSMRLHFGNRYGEEPIKLGAVTVWNGENCARVTFNGERTLTLNPEEKAVSDILQLSVSAGDILQVLLYFCADCPIPRTVSGVWATEHSAPGDFTEIPDFPASEEPLRDPFPFPIPEPLPVLTGIDLLAEADAKAVVAFGDSITEFRTWTDPLTKRLEEERSGKTVLLNLGIGGNRMLLPTTPSFAAVAGNMFGDAGAQRVQWDILDKAKVKTVIFALGINDITQPGSGEMSPPVCERCTFEDFTASVCILVNQLHAAGIRVIGCSITPFGGMNGCCTETMMLRNQINDWLRQKAGDGELDGFVDFAAAIENPEKQGYMLPEYDSGDHLHPSAEGGKRMAAVVPTELLDWD